MHSLLLVPFCLSSFFLLFLITKIRYVSLRQRDIGERCVAIGVHLQPLWWNQWKTRDRFHAAQVPLKKQDPAQPGELVWYLAGVVNIHLFQFEM